MNTLTQAHTSHTQKQRLLFSPSILIVCFLCLSAHQGFTQTTVELGNLSATNISGNSVSINRPAEKAFNGLTSGPNEGWMGGSGAEQFLMWDINPFENTQFDTDIVETIQFTLTIYTGIAFSSSNGNLQEFIFRYAEAGQDFTNVITDYDFLSSNKVSNNEVLAINSAADGSITAEVSNEQAIYTLAFEVPHTTRRFQLESLRNDKIVFTVEEIITSASVVVPEPSTYALLLGLACLGTSIVRKKTISVEYKDYI